MSVRDNGDAASQRTGVSSSSGNLSETSSQQSDSKFLKKRALRRHHDDHAEETDVVEQKRNLQEGIFACMYTLVRQSTQSRMSYTVLKISLEFLMNFIVAFNPSFHVWKIDTSSPVWQVVRWTVWRSPIMRLYGYDTYVIVMYIMVAAVILAVSGLVWLTLAMRNQEQSKALHKAAGLLHIVFDAMFICCYVSFFDYFVFMADCDFLGPVKQHLYFTGVNCLDMPHLLHMTVALVAAAVFLLVTALMVVASSDLNPVSRGDLSSPAALVRLRVLFGKAVYIIIADCLDSNVRLQCLGMSAAVLFILYFNFREMPFYSKAINVVWTGMWFGILYTCGVLDFLTLGEDQSEVYRRKVTKIVLWGIVPSILLGRALTGLYAWWAMRPACNFKNLCPGVKLSKVYKFASVYEVERLARVMRKFDADGLVDEEKAALGETIIKAGLQVFPNAPHLLILNANFVLEVRKDGPAARTQLQLAAKHAPTIIQKYQIFCTNEVSKRLKGSQQDCMDLQAYIEFKRNSRAALRVHREALVMQAELWQLCMRPSLSVAQFDRAMDALEVAVNRANQVYRRVLERYPNNGKLLRCYGKFLEDARHDHLAATRAYTEANRSGAGGALLSLDLSSGLHGADKPEFLTSMSMEDDAVVVIDAEGTIMMVSQAVEKFFGYPKVELEGANVSMLMPQPFSQRHDGYLARYVAGGEPRILDTVREVVALHKDRYVFPVSLCVTRLSGVGADCIFLGVIRPLPPDVYTLRAWVAPNGALLCSDQQFASAIGVFEGELVGHPLSSLVATPGAAEALLELCRAGDGADLAEGNVVAELSLKHRYGDPFPVHVTVRPAGTEAQRILVLHCRRTDGQDGSMIAVDTHMRVKFASCEVALLLGYSMRKLASMRLDQLLPPPFNALHAKWLRDPPHAVPPSSCRSGKVVHLQAETGAQIPVRLQVGTMDGLAVGANSAGSTIYVVKVHKVTSEELFREKRLVLTADFTGRVLTVSPYDSQVFGFPATSLAGSNLADCVDIFADWRERSGETQMQLILLALLYKEQEMPGTSWRVRVHLPDSAAEAVAPPRPGDLGLRGNKRIVSLSACLQVEMLEDGESGDVDDASSSEPRVRITLWRRDLLTGVLELDEDLVVRRASPLTGLITGLPTTAMLRKPLSRLLNIPSVASWDQLVAAASSQPGGGGGGHHHKKSALKATPERGSISPVMAFIGPHPDTGTMRLMVQGVQTLGPGGRAKVMLTMHPDTTFTGAHANLMKVLKLDEASGRRRVSDAGTAAADEDDNYSAVGAAPHSRLATASAGRRSTRRSKSTKPRHLSAAMSGTAADGGGAEDEAGRVAAADVVYKKPPGLQQLEMVGAAESTSGLAVTDSIHPREDRAGRAESGGAADGGRKQRSTQDEEASAGLATGDEGPSASLHHRAGSRSEFVTQWVRTLSRGASGSGVEANGPLSQRAQQAPPAAAQDDAEEAAGHSLVSQGSGQLVAAALSSDAAAVLPLSRLFSVAEPTFPVNETGLLEPGVDRQLSRCVGRKYWRDKTAARAAGSLLWRTEEISSRRSTCDGGAAAAAPEEIAPTVSIPERPPSEDGESSVDGSQAAGSVMSSATDVTLESGCAVDGRRSRLLRALYKLLLGPALMKHIDRLRLQSYLLIFVMFLAHAISYCVITALIKTEHNNVYVVHRQAMAMDRSQLVVVRCIAGAFCQRANVTDKSSACANTLNVTLGKMTAAVTVMEEYHQAVYLGLQSSRVAKPQAGVYDVWTNHDLEYHVYLDTAPPRVALAHAGAWQLGNRFIAAAREALYLLPNLGDMYKLHRTYQFLKTNGLGPLFEGYASSLDLLVDAAWLSIGKLRHDLIAVLIVEAIVVQLCCTFYMLFLVQRTEVARLLGVLAMLGLPGPVLRQLANTDIRITADSDDDSDRGDDDSVNGDEGFGRSRGSAAIASGDGGAAGGPLMTAAPCGPETVMNSKGDNGPGKMDCGGARPHSALGGCGQADTAPCVGRISAVDLMPPDRSAACGDQCTDDAATKATEQDARPKRSSPAGPQLGSSRKGVRGMNLHSRICGAKLRFQINGKALRPSLWNVSKFMVPFFLWNVAVILVYAVSLVKLNGMQGPLASLNMASHVTYRYTRVRVIALAFVTQDDAVSRAVWRPLLINELGLFESEYNAVMYGGEPTSMTQHSTFRRMVPAGTFASGSFAQAFFRNKDCFRYDKTACFPPGHEYYEVTHNGLDVMVRRLLTEMQLLTLDQDADVAYNGTRYRFMAMVGANDLYEGLQQAAQLFVDYSISRYEEIALLHTVLLAVSVVLVLAFFLFVLWPHIRRLLRDAARLGALLSMVPPEMDVRAHVRAVLRRSAGSMKTAEEAGGTKTEGGTKAATAAAAAATVSQQSDADLAALRDSTQGSALKES